MTTRALQEQARALGDPTRHALFRHIADADRPVTIVELNAELDLNHNAIRQHLAKLVAAGLVLESRVRGEGRGRPRLVYELDHAAGGPWAPTGPYQRLSALLLEIIRTRQAPAEVGRRAADGFRTPSPSGDAVADMAASMARQGFQPEVRRKAASAEIVLHTCPFADIALADRDTICSLHLGIAEGLAEGGAASVTEVVAYDPRKAQCRVRLALGGDPTERPRGTLSLRGA